MTRLFVFTCAYLCALVSVGQHTQKLKDLYYKGDYHAVTQILVDDELLEPEALFVIANAFHKLEDFESALMYYELSSDESTELPDYFLNKAICEISMGDLVSAERSLFRFEDVEGQHPMVYYYFGVIDFEVMEYRTALEAVDQALDMNPEYMEAWYLKGAIMVDLDKYAQAEECFQMAHDLNPTHERTTLNLALAQVYNKSYDEAFAILNDLIESNSELKAEALFYRAEANFYLHLLDQACADWTAAAEMGDEYAKENLKIVCEKGKAERHKQRKINKITL
ncbi:MAG: tetratricopeptide repeat protein [Flavobacteriales bacterium]